MNNSKVRIYDLSRELNLENKDLLVICEELNIAAKSHSSTISETEAVRIRAAAEKLVARPAQAKKQPTVEKEKEKTERPPVVKASGEKKPQILQIRHKTNQDESSAETLIAPKPAATPIAPTSLMSPSTPDRPVSRPQVAVSETTLRPESKAPARPTSAEPIAMRTAPARAPERNGSDESDSESPARPTVKPVLKVVGAPVRPAGTTADRPARPGPAGERRPVREAVPAVPELNRPQRKIVQIKPLASAGAISSGSGSGDDDDSIDVIDNIDKLELRRPTLPKQVKKPKAWSKSEEEEAENAAKAAKVAGKKRKSQVIVDDDEDDDEDGQGEDGTAVVVSLSIVRPPKPASAQRAPTPIAAPARKKPSRGGEGSRHHDRRKEAKAVAEKPEFITLGGSLTVRDLADMLTVPETEIVRQLFFKGIAVSVTQILDVATATMVSEEMGISVKTQEEQAPATKVTEMLDVADLDNLHRRPPVVTIMGHVDHGKTTLLDAIRETKVAQGEAGGITQHIGAYHVDVTHNGKMQQVVFLDTPGHEAFTAMRARGARVTDVAILVVAADDGVRPQTIEAIRHAQAAEVPIIVAINKMDKPGANADRVQQELTSYGLQSEAWGGDTVMVPVSALKGENLDTLLEMILLVSDVEDLQANPNRPAKGTVIEAHLDKAKGPVATLLIQNGTLRVSDTLVAGHVFCKVRAMVDDRLQRVEAASPSFAVEVLGMSDVPAAGDEFEVYLSEKEARAVADKNSESYRHSRLQQMMSSRRVTLNTLSAQAQEGDLKELNLILKADVQGSVEAILGSLRQLPQKEVQVRVLFSAPGEVTETDVDLAAASGAVIVGFNTSLASGARALADTSGVDIREYDIIYNLLDDIQAAMEGLLDPEQVEEPLGQVEVRAVFQAGRGNIAGCYVLSGKAVRNCQIRIKRGEQLVFTGVLDSLKRVKDDVKEMNAGFECGIRLDRFNDWKEKDIIETFQFVSKRRTLTV
jgi:translation initiation factor IF-2